MLAPLLLLAVTTAPLTLEQAVARALATHPDVLSADAQAQSARLTVDDARAQQLGLTASVNALGRHATGGLMDTSGGPTSTTDTATANGTLTASVPIFTGFKLTNTIAQAGHASSEAEALRAAARADLAFQVTQAYWNLYRQEALGRAEGDLAADANQVLKLTETTLKLGRATPMDVTRARVSLLNARGDLLATQAQEREARTALAKLVGMTVDELVIADPVPVTSAPVGSGAAVATPRLSAARSHDQAAVAGLEVTKGDRWPQLSLLSSYQYGNNPYDPTLGAYGVSTSLSGTWDVRVVLAYNVFDMGKVERAVKRSEADVAVAHAGLEKARRDAESDLTLAREHVKNAFDRLQMAESASSMAADTLRWTETRYRQGYSLQVDVIDARRSLLTALNQRIGALCDYQIARAELATALGRVPGK